MRLMERDLITLYIHDKTTQTGALGSVTPGFATTPRTLRAVVQPLSGASATAIWGTRSLAMLELTIPPGGKIAVGDGLSFDAGDSSNPAWVCVAAREWHSHMLATIERRAGL